MSTEDVHFQVPQSCGLVFMETCTSLWLKRVERLNWWIAVTGGAVSALVYVLLNTLTPLTYGVTPDVDRLIDSNNITYLGLGMLTGFVFWWIGIFRNAAFPLTVVIRFALS
jgi:hypothetical protein